MAAYSKKSKTFTSEPKGVEGVLRQFSDMIVARMEQMKGENWEKPWISSSGYGRPTNVGGRDYNGSNSFFLQILADMKGYSIPTYLTFNQAKEQGLSINKGEKSFPVVYWNFSIKDRDGKPISFDDYKNRSKEEKAKCLVIPFMKYYNVFNVDQTNIKEVKPELYAKLQEKYAPVKLSDDNGMYSHPGIDRMVAEQAWVCPIYVKEGDRAYFSPANDYIQVPMKAQFKTSDTPEGVYQNGMEFYSTLIHEMAHSTGHESRLNRLEASKFGDPKYAKEELVAELTSANIGATFGFDSKISDNSVKYLNNWISALKEEPKFIVSLMADVNKASEMILDKIDQQQLKLDEPVYLAKNDLFQQMPDDIECPFRGTSVVKMKDGSFGVTTTYHGTTFAPKAISDDKAELLMKLEDPKEQKIFANSTLPSLFKSEISKVDTSLSQDRNSSLKI